MRADRRDSRRETVLRWVTPLIDARCISGCATLNASAATALSPPAIAVSTFFMKVFIRDIRALFRSVRRAVWRMRLRAEAVLAMRSVCPGGGEGEKKWVLAPPAPASTRLKGSSKETSE